AAPILQPRRGLSEGLPADVAVGGEDLGGDPDLDRLRALALPEAEAGTGSGAAGLPAPGTNPEGAGPGLADGEGAAAGSEDRPAVDRLGESFHRAPESRSKVALLVRLAARLGTDEPESRASRLPLRPVAAVRASEHV